MVKSARTITIGKPQQPSKPRILTSQEAEAVNTGKRPDLTFDPPPSAPLDHERNQPSPVGKLTQPKKVSTMANVNPANYPAQPATPAAVKATTTLPSEQDVARLMPTIPAEFRNNELIRKRAYYYGEAAKLGKTAGVGELTLIALAEKSLDGAIEGALAVDDKYTHATEMFYHFQNARAKAKPLTEESIKNKARQLNWFIKLGAHYSNNAKQFFNDMVDLHNKLAASPVTLKDMKYTAVYEDVNNLVRKQMMKVEEATDNQPVALMDEEEARTYIFKTAPDQETALELLISAFKSLEKANEGKKENEKKQTPARAGLKSADIAQAMQIVQDYAQHQMNAEDKKVFFNKTSHKKPGKKKAAPPATTTGATVGSASNVENMATLEVPEGYYPTEDGELAEVPDGYIYDREQGELREIEPEETENE